MPTKPIIKTLDYLAAPNLGESGLLVTPAVRTRAEETIPITIYESVEELPPTLDSLVVIGGGTLIDQAKYWWAKQSGGTQLIAIPSIWGSGAEVSPVAILNFDSGKEIHMGEEFLPDVVCIWPELANSLPAELARHACGDTWSHALEGFLSPIADSALRVELAQVIRSLLSLPIANNPAWFEASARACSGQARSSVGLVHGIAHTLEKYLRAAYPEEGWGHARLCSVFLLPVLEFNMEHSGKFGQLVQTHELDQDGIFRKLAELHEPLAYRQALPFLEQHWMEVARDPCSRTNSALVRRGSKDYFLEYQSL